MSKLTPNGQGAVAVILLKGAGAESVFQKHFSGQLKPEVPNFGRLRLLNGQDEEAVVHRISGNEIEIHTHGGELLVSAVEELFIRNGAVKEQAISGNETLTQQEIAWKLLPYAPTERIAQILLDQYNAESADEADLPLPEWAKHLIEPFRIVLAGAANAGKSSLLNTVLGFQRSIVSPVAGTTRDVVSGQTALEGFPFAFFDTAGLRDGAANEIEKEGIRRAALALTDADLVVWVIDVTEPVEPPPHLIEPQIEPLICCNKVDLITDLQCRDLLRNLPRDAVTVSAKTGEGVERLLAAIFHRLVPHLPQSGDRICLDLSWVKFSDVR